MVVAASPRLKASFKCFIPLGVIGFVFAAAARAWGFGEAFTLALGFGEAFTLALGFGAGLAVALGFGEGLAFALGFGKAFALDFGDAFDFGEALAAAAWPLALALAP